MDVHPFISFAVFASGIEQVLMMPLAIYLPILLLGAIIPSSSSVDYAISVAIVFVLPLSWFIAHALLWWRGGRTGMNVLNPIVLVGTLLAVLNIVCVPQALVHVLFDWQWCREALQFVGVLMFTCIFGATYWIPRLSSAFDSSSTSEKNSDSSRAPSMSLYYTKAECASWPIEKHRFYLLCKSSLVQHFSSFFGPNAGWYEPLPSGSRLTRMEVRVVSIAIELVLYWQRSAPLRSASPIVGLFMRALPNLTKNPMPMFNCARDALPQDAVETYRVWQSRYPPKQM